MTFDQITSVLLSLGSIALGAFFGALRSKLIASNERNKLHYFIYSFCVLAIFFVLFSLYYFTNDFFLPNWYGIVVLAISVVANVILFWYTKKFLVVRNVFSIAELNPIINNFTANADHAQLRLFGGDLNFLGNGPTQIDQNPQYVCLRSNSFTHLYILCEAPKTNSDRIRFGKILHDFAGAELRYYEPEKADLRIRGRMKELHGVTKILIYTKVAPGNYKAIETDISNTSGALYNNIWELVWTKARIPSKEETDLYKTLYLT